MGLLKYMDCVRIALNSLLQEAPAGCLAAVVFMKVQLQPVDRIMMFSALLHRSTWRAQHLLPLTRGDKRLPADASITRAGGGTRSLITTPPTEAKPFSEIPGPRRLPLLGSLLTLFLEVRKKPKPVLQIQKDLMKKYGLIYRLKVPTIKELVMIHDPQDIEVMFRAEGKYPSRPPIQVLKQARNELKMEMAVLHS